MGSGIAQQLLISGMRVNLVEADGERASMASFSVEEGIKSYLAYKNRSISGYSSTSDVEDIMGSFRACVGLAGAEGSDPDVVIESVFEDAGLKRAVIEEAESRFPECTLLASNTSSLSIVALGQGLKKRERFLGLHFFNPVPRSALIEIVVSPDTAGESTKAAEGFAGSLGKETIVVSDRPGFATSRLGVALGLEAIRMLEEGVASAEDIDRAMVLGYRHPMGPLRLTDLVGLDVRLAISQYLERELGPRFSPPRILHEKVAANELGKKSGKGFFLWDK